MNSPNGKRFLKWLMKLFSVSNFFVCHKTFTILTAVTLLMTVSIMTSASFILIILVSSKVLFLMYFWWFSCTIYLNPNPIFIWFWWVSHVLCAVSYELVKTPIKLITILSQMFADSLPILREPTRSWWLKSNTPVIFPELRSCPSFWNVGIWFAVFRFEE